MVEQYTEKWDKKLKEQAEAQAQAAKKLKEAVATSIKEDAKAIAEKKEEIKSIPIVAKAPETVKISLEEKTMLIEAPTEEVVPQVPVAPQLYRSRRPQPILSKDC